MTRTLFPLFLMAVQIATACAPTSAEPAVSEVATAPVMPSPSTHVSPPAQDVQDVLTYRGDQARSGRFAGPGPVGEVGIRWTFEAGAPIGSQVVVVDDVVEFVSTDGTLHALDLETGALRWQARIGSETHASPSVAGDLVLIGAEDGIHTVRWVDGARAWTATSAGPTRGTPVILDGIAIGVSTSGTAVALDVATGETVWARALPAGADTSVAAADGIVVVGLGNGTAVGLDASDGTERWQTDTLDGARIGTPTIDEGRVFIVTLDSRDPAGDHHVAALDLETGQQLWRTPSPGKRSAYSPAVADGLAIVGSEGQILTAFDVATGEQRWQTAAPGVVEVVSAIAGDTVYSASNGGVAFALDVATGTERWQVPIKGVPYGVAVTGGLVLVGTSSGLLYAIGDTSN
jgi:eukaryotic-like serine/threonine-protein kinase